MNILHLHLLLLVLANGSAGTTSARQSLTKTSQTNSIPTTNSQNSSTPSHTSGNKTANETPSSKLAIRLADMPYKQVLCQNISQVMTGTTLNVSWTSKGSYGNTLYAKYATDGYQAWVSAMPTQPGTSGTKLPAAGKNGKKGSETDYLLSYQVRGCVWLV